MLFSAANQKYLHIKPSTPVHLVRAHLRVVDAAVVSGPAGAYAGLDRFAARDKLWKDMEAAGMVIKKEAYTTR